MWRTFWVMTLLGAWVELSFNPLVHIDPFGTVVLPLMLLMLRSPFLFGYAKPVPVNFRALRHPRLSTILVAAAGPGMNCFWRRSQRSPFTSLATYLLRARSGWLQT